MKSFYFTIMFAVLHFMAQAQVWEKTYLADSMLNSGYGVALDILKTQDNGFLMAGEIDLPTGAIRHYIQLIKTDATGTEQWRKIVGCNYGDIRMDRLNNIYEMPDGGLIIGGSTSYNYQGIYLIRTNAIGDTIWTKIHPTPLSSNVVGYSQTPNFEFLSLVHSNTDLILYKTDTLGNILTTKTLNDFFTPLDIQTLNNDDYILVGHQNGILHLARLDPQGDTLWTRSHQFSTGDAATCIQTLANGDFMIGGYSNGFAGQSPLVVRFDGNGNIIWQNYLSLPLPSNAMVSDIALKNDGNFIVTGSIDENFFFNLQNGFVAEITPTGQTVWLNAFDTLMTNGAAIALTHNNCFVVGGGNVGGYFLQHQCGTTFTNPQFSFEITLNIAPNPSTDKIKFHILTPTYQNFTFKLVDFSGKVVRSETIGNDYELERNGLVAGIYFFGLYIDNQLVKNGKVIFVD